MAYRFKHRETVPRNVKRIAAEQLDEAIALLKRKGGASREDSVQGVRQNIKKTRALLRLVRPELGDFFRDENIRLRDVGLKLSELRDASALIDTVDNLRHRANGAAPKNLLTSVRRQLNLQKRQLEDQAAAEQLLPGIAAELRKIRQSIRYWPLQTDGFKAIAYGLERTFRDGRKALAVARKSSRTEDYHEWRKRAKDHWYQIRLLNRVWGEVMSGYEQSLKELEDALGDDINLWLLEKRTQEAVSQEARRAPTSLLSKTIGSARQDLRQRALEIGAKVYAEKPREFIRQLKKLWKVW
jgi:CHAD domain-containing protein